MATLAEIRAKIQAQDSKSGGNSSYDNAIYPHWNIDTDTTASLRFLPDGDAENDFFWLERLIIKLPFKGVKGGEENRPTLVQVPCVEMWGMDCPVLTEVRPWYKMNDENMEKLASKYWKKRSYLFQGFVRESSLKEDEIPENLIRRFVMSPQLFKMIKGILMDPDLKELPTDYEKGIDFRVSKTMKTGDKGTQYAGYETSSWARSETPLSPEELAAIETHGLFDLKNYLPKKPEAVELQVIAAMFQASVDGDLYDPEKFAQYYKPAGMNFDSTSNNSTSDNVTVPTAEVTPTTVKEETKEPEAAPAVEPSTGNGELSAAEQILARIRNREETTD